MIENNNEKAMIQKTGKIRFRIEVQDTSNRGLPIWPPMFNLRLDQLDCDDNLINSFILPEVVLKSVDINKEYDRLVEKIKSDNL